MLEIEERLLAKGITVPHIVEAAMALRVPGGYDSRETACALAGTISAALRDPDVASLLLGAILLEDENRIRNHSEIPGDTNGPVGISIAEMIGGARARFEFNRYETEKPGILFDLGPVLDNAVTGLIAGCTARLSECV
ncbi:MAG: phosphatidylglycerophosphatase A [Methanomicrobiaceae archaeon]|nr:phosphatidylglycerophosphatase A [Methanomicrobiaceae archaeon]